MKISFPALPVFDKERWLNDLHLFESPSFKDLLDTFVPFAYFELPDYAGQNAITKFNELFQAFANSLNSKNTNPFPDYVRELGEEGGLAYFYLQDEYVHAHSKMFYFDFQRDNNYGNYTGVMIRNHLDQKQFTYGVLKIAESFSQYLKSQNINFRLFLRKHDHEDNVEVEM